MSTENEKILERAVAAFGIHFYQDVERMAISIFDKEFGSFNDGIPRAWAKAFCRVLEIRGVKLTPKDAAPATPVPPTPPPPPLPDNVIPFRRKNAKY